MKNNSLFPMIDLVSMRAKTIQYMPYKETNEGKNRFNMKNIPEYDLHLNFSISPSFTVIVEFSIKSSSTLLSLDDNNGLDIINLLGGTIKN